ncbi:hypothetical protein CH267_02045 [Rhodococcus sp. 06-621-2]|nr:hypothetical protein [Rhodococcus sp. 06-621-2]OZC62340.1 hypothetical protein CH267_02045 [Rhodococcus sp. 06-621-2]
MSAGLSKANVSDALIDIYLDGMCTGLATGAMNFGGATEDQADAIADTAMEHLKADPASMEQVRQQIIERLTGVDSGPYTFTAHGVVE